MHYGKNTSRMHYDSDSLEGQASLIQSQKSQMCAEFLTCWNKEIVVLSQRQEMVSDLRLGISLYQVLTWNSQTAINNLPLWPSG